MTVGTAENGTVQLAYEIIGSGSGEPLLLLMGLDSSMRWWPDGFCRELAGRGFAVIRFDYRDVGRSVRAVRATEAGTSRARAPYSILDMVADTTCVLDGLGVPSAHLVGYSLGASIALATALHRPDRVRSVASISGLPRGYRLAEAARYVDPLGLARMLRVATRRPRTREGHVRQQVAIARMQASRRFPFDERWARATADQVCADGPGDPAGAARQLAAIRTEARALRHPERITVPLLAVHGADDPLLRPSGAAALARAVPGGRAVVFPGMGHEIPRRLWAAIADEIVRNARRPRVLMDRDGGHGPASAPRDDARSQCDDLSA
jgi:pimeloyl-ACP methyl ester carboxylesterase